ncbi:cobalamin biosynthesis protein CobW [Larsenimonas suaedae]|uniref:Cobalamin biosynthesis protein CobW n=1 Tax=Larsenimonas suaedae TaxID=1851019 RepID=A0ABU1GXP0_9GAMM|nr:cobalamin biosynthesis protein CobW [Larsenimonas suaedae]MCM2971548.1 cobalamin biosynthesis protein CobW [Larsenimonas suaedae]MDR5896804.1 cobalamin biosynthesis protein CobW [Larsenimonas suaedae]
MHLNKIPATVVTGFLGSGKTTLLSNVLRQARGKRIAVIVNEFGEMDVDSELLRSCQLDHGDDACNTLEADDDGIYELANGCICCTVEEEFLPVMKKLVERRDQIDHIVIETSGLALPNPLVQAFNWPDVKQFCTVDAVITVVDGPALAEGRVAHDEDRVAHQRLADESLDHDPSLKELLDDQLDSADLVAISKTDQMEEGDLERIEDELRARLAPHVKLIRVRDGEIDASAVMGLNLESEARIEALETHHDHHHTHGHDHHHAHDDFDNVVVRLGQVDPARLKEALAEAIRQYPIVRAKGFADVGKPMRQVVHGVGHRLDMYFDRPWQSDEHRDTKLVLIGKGLDRQAITDALAKAQMPTPA